MRAFEIGDLGTPTSIDDNLGDGVGQMFNLYPNPTSDEITIEVLTQEKIEVFELMNLQGQLVESINGGELRRNAFKVNVNKLSAGVYMARLVDSNGLSQKFIIK